MKKFGLIIRKTRLKRGLRIADIAKKLSLTMQYIQKIEVAKEIPKPEVVIALSRLLDLDINKMLKLAVKTKVKQYEIALKEKYNVE